MKDNMAHISVILTFSPSLTPLRLPATTEELEMTWKALKASTTCWPGGAVMNHTQSAHGAYAPLPDVMVVGVVTFSGPGQAVVG